MDKRRALGTAIGLSAVIFVFVSLLSIITKDTEFSNPLNQFLFLVILLISTVFASLYYFKDRKIKEYGQEGIFLGLNFLLVGFALDIITAIFYVFVFGKKLSELIIYYSTPIFMISIFILIIVPLLVGQTKK